MSLKVIGAGCPRTATWSQKLALEQLGFGPCYHMSEALKFPEHWPLWATAAKGEAYVNAAVERIADFFVELDALSLDKLYE